MEEQINRGVPEERRVVIGTLSGSACRLIDGGTGKEAVTGIMYTNTCRFCGKIFIGKMKRSSCEACRELDEALFDRIVKYLGEYPYSNALQISDGINVPAMEILRYIDEGRLQIVKGEFNKV